LRCHSWGQIPWDEGQLTGQKLPLTLNLSLRGLFFFLLTALGPDAASDANEFQPRVARRTETDSELTGRATA